MSVEDLVEVRVHGRGGQGAVLAVTLAAEVAFRNGYYPQSFPFFGAERRGAPVAAFLRYSSSPLMPRCRITGPDCVAVFDPLSLPVEIFLAGLKENGLLLLNSTKETLPGGLKTGSERKIYIVDAAHIAAGCGLIFSGEPLISSVMLGALVRVLQLAPQEGLAGTLRGKFPRYEKENLAGAERGFQEVKEVFEDAIFR